MIKRCENIQSVILSAECSSLSTLYIVYITQTDVFYGVGFLLIYKAFFRTQNIQIQKCYKVFSALPHHNI